jgi:uncharacterized protein YndB with AHSA1/START domain
MTDQPRRHHGRSIHHELDIAAAADKVWSAWADPQRIAMWFVDRAKGFAKPGEVVTWYFDAMQYEVPQPVVAAEPGKSFATAGEFMGRAWLLEVLLQHRGGHTTIRLINSGFASDSPEADEQFEGVDSGWLMALHTLKHWLEVHADRGDDGRRVHSLVMVPAPSFSWAWLAPLFTTPAGLTRWLGTTQAPAELTPGCRVTVDLAPGERLDGVVLCRSRREVLLSWPGRSAVVGLKAFGFGPTTMLALDVSGWGAKAATDAAVRAWAEPALRRLAAIAPPAAASAPAP